MFDSVALRLVCRLVPMALLLTVAVNAVAAAELTVGSKRFTESYILGEIVARTAQRAGEAKIGFKPGLGNTAIVFEALKSGAIDIYPEYTGTVALELLHRDKTASLEELNAALAPLGLTAGIALGFNNSYALAMREDTAQRQGIRTISDLARHPNLKFGLSQEFLHRRDGWPALRTVYRLSSDGAQGLDHGIAYEAIAAGRIDIMDVYATDAKIARYSLRVLEDDQHFFPAYSAVLLYRNDLPRRLPGTFAALRQLAGALPAARMIELNAAAELDGKPFGEIAESFLDATAVTAKTAWTARLRAALGAEFWRLTGQHVMLVLVSLLASAAAGIPLGVWAARSRAGGMAIFAVTGTLQTVPSLALLAFLVAAFNTIGVLPALAALSLYGLLPIVRNTATGFAGIPRGLIAAACALGLQRRDILRYVELPLALPTILAGIKTSAVINVGTATIAAFIGAGGFGERIVAGLAVNDNALLLAGAIPAAGLALLTEGLFALLESFLVSAGLQAAKGPPREI